MDNFIFTIWLKESVLGIIILGALGSAVCILTFKLVALIAVKWIPSSYSRYHDWKLDRAFDIGKILKFFHSNSHQVGLVSFFVFKSTKCVVCTVISAASLIIFVILYGKGVNTLTYGNYLFLVISMVMGFLGYSEYRELKMVSNAFQKEANKQSQADSD